MAVLFPQWASDRLKKQQPSLKNIDAPVVLYEKAQNALRLHAVDAAAVAAGLFIGQSLTNARALCPDLVAMEARADEDAEAFRKFCEWLLRYSPLVSVWKTGEAFVNLTGCERIFGGESAIAADIIKRLEEAGFTAKISIAQTPGAAHAFASFGSGWIVPSEATKEMLAPLPVEALRIGEVAAEKLHRFGLKRIGQLYDMPRAPLTARFTKDLLKRLSQALGNEAEPLAFISISPHYHANMRFVEPIVSIDSAVASLKELSDDLGEQLCRAGKGGRFFELALFRVDNEVVRVSVRASGPAKSPAHIARLFTNRLQDLRGDIDTGFGFDQLRLGAFEVDRIAPFQHGVFDHAATDTALSELKDRLSNRLGTRRVCRIELKNSHLPECADSMEPVTSATEMSPPAGIRLRRPVQILSYPEEIEALAQVPDGPPVRFRWRRVTYRIARASGPERISDEWRHQEEPKLTRDYFRIEDEAGRRYWVFREGLYDRETSAPKWFLHGFFA